MTESLDRLTFSELSPEAFSEAYTRGFHLTVRFLLSKGASADLAEEVSQSAWARGWEARAQLLVKEKLLAWINRIAYHRFCNDKRRSNRQSDLPDSAGPVTTQSTPMKIDAGRVMSMCSPRDRAMLTQRYYQGMDMKEIAAAQGLTEIAVRVRIHRCQCGIRSAIEECGCH